MALNVEKCDVLLKLDGILANTLSDNSLVRDGLSVNDKKSYSNGAGSTQAQLIFHTQRTLATATAETLDLTTLTGALGATFGTYAFTKVRAIIVILTTTNAGYRLELGAADADQFVGPLKTTDDIVVVGAGSRFMAESAIDGWTVDATHKALKINNPSGGSCTYRLIVIGQGSAA